MWIHSGGPVATLIGDVVGSRRSPDRGALHAGLTAALAQANTAVPALLPLRITLGDEFQGAYADVPTAIAAMLRLRLSLQDGIDTRYGLGYGPVQLLSPDGQVQDGPGWWSARAAIEAAAGRRGRGTAVRAHFRDDADPGTPYVDAAGAPLSGLVNASLRSLDELLAALSDLDVRLIRGTLAGRTQAQLAADEGVTQSAVSQRLARHGAWALVEALEWVTPPPEEPTTQ